jgi:DNA adenine methylase
MRLVNRLGNKESLSEKIYTLFPPHKIYIEPFFGGGGMFFNKPRSPINHINDLDNDIFNLWHVLTRQKDELLNYLKNVPYSDYFFKWIKGNEPQNEIEKAVWFVVRSNWGFRGMPETLCIGVEHTKKSTIQTLQECYDKITSYETISIQNKDFRKFFASIRIRDEHKKCFIYADKPYSETGNNYGKKGKEGVWSEKDDKDLLEVLIKSNIKFAISEYSESSFESLALAAGLQKIYIDSSANSGLGKEAKRKEVIWINYTIPNLLF